MKKLITLLLLCTSLIAGPATAENLEGVLPLAKDDIAATAQVRNSCDRIVMVFLWFIVIFLVCV